MKFFLQSQLLICINLFEGIHYIRQDESDICEEIEVEDGIFLYKPIVDESETPKIGKEFTSIEECIRMYENYADKAGFGVRLSTQNTLKSGIVERKYLVCNREGLAKGVNKDTLSEETSEIQIRTSSISRTGCMARVKFKLNDSHTKYELYDFEEKHNHTFIPVVYRNLTKKKRKMNHKQKIYMQQLGGTNIGATRAHHLYAATNGGYDSVDATETEFRNHTRDLNSHIGDSDAQMLINKMENRKKNVANFSFEYSVVNSQLDSLFWADEMAKYNYKEFGDTISFDATFRTNKYVLFYFN